MITAREIMTTDVVTVSPQTEIVKAAKVLLERGINGAPVVNDQSRVVGILCQSDLVAQQKKIPLPTLFTMVGGYIPLSSNKQLEKEIRKIAALTVADAMTPNPVTVTPDTPLEKIAGLMVDKNFHTLPVVEHDRLVGVIGKEDVLKTFTQSHRAGPELSD
jgi:CBS-domain-containing membrane protein